MYKHCQAEDCVMHHTTGTQNLSRKSSAIKPNEVSRYVYKLGNETEKYTVNASGSCKNMVLQKSWMSNVNEIKDLRVNNIQNICPQK